MASIVLLLSGDAGLTEIPDARRLRHCFRPPLEVNQLVGQGWTVTSMRDQVEAVALGRRVEIRDHSGKHDFQKLAKSAVGILDSTGATVRAFGVNFQIALPVDAADAPGLFVAHNLLNFERVSAVAPVESASVEMRFRLDEVSAGLSFRPRQEAEDPADLLLIVNMHHNRDIRGLSSTGDLGSFLATYVGTMFGRVLDLVESL